VHQLREWSGREGAGHGSRSKPEVVLWCLVVSTSRGRVSPGRIDKLIISTGKEKDDAPKKTRKQAILWVGWRGGAGWIESLPPPFVPSFLFLSFLFL